MSKELVAYTGRDFLKVAEGIPKSPSRGKLMKPGDWIVMPYAQLTSWFKPVSFDSRAQMAEGITGLTKVTLLSVTREQNGILNGIRVHSSQGGTELTNSSVHPSLFHNYGAMDFWQGSLLEQGPVGKIM